MNILSLLTLRYDPLNIYVPTLRLKDVSGLEILNSYSRQNIASVRQIENKIRSVIRREVEGLAQDRVCIALSAGVDSNVVLCLLRDEYPDLDIECINISFDEMNEAHEARKIAEQKGAGFQQVYVEDPLRDLPLMLNIIKEPRWNIYQYYFVKKAKSISDMLFTGDGGDEVFAGYTFRYSKFLQNCREGSNWLERVKLYLSCHERDWVADQQDMFTNRAGFDWSSIYSLLRGYFDNSLHPLDQVLLADYNGKLLHDFIPTNDKYYRFYKIRGASPLLDNDVIDLAISIPSEIRYNLASNIGKSPLREILRRSAPRFGMYGSPKVGYGMNLINLWTNSGREIVNTMLDNGRIFEDYLIDKNWYYRTLKRIEENLDIRYISKILQLLSLEVWYRIFVTAEMNPMHPL
jgi:asparagine synthase (glutamine-hydrolysing)